MTCDKCYYNICIEGAITMKTKDLVNLWNAPDNTRLTPRQMSIRLPLHVAAKISALCEMFPNKTKTEIIGDLLATALEDVAEGLPNDPYPDEDQISSDEMLGERKRYGVLVEKYLKEMEIETGEFDSAEDEKTVRKQSADIRSKAALDSRTQRVAERGARAAKQRRTRNSGRRS
jgi:hypothetical protein